jgi:hypothetical protein
MAPGSTVEPRVRGGKTNSAAATVTEPESKGEAIGRQCIEKSHEGFETLQPSRSVLELKTPSRVMYLIVSRMSFNRKHRSFNLCDGG